MNELIEEIAAAMWDDDYDPEPGLPKWKDLEKHDAQIVACYRRMAKIAIKICESKSTQAI